MLKVPKFIHSDVSSELQTTTSLHLLVQAIVFCLDQCSSLFTDLPVSVLACCSFTNTIRLKLQYETAHVTLLLPFCLFGKLKSSMVCLCCLSFCSHSAVTALASWPLLKHINQVPASEPLHLWFLLVGNLSPRRLSAHFLVLFRSLPTW